MTQRTSRRAAQITGVVAGAFAAGLLLAPVANVGTEPALAAATPWNEVPPPDGAKPGSRFYEAGYRSDVVDIPIRGNDGDLEYKIKMKPGDTVVYSWEVRPVLPSPDFFYSEFHGHTEQPPGQRGDLVYYRKATGLKESGVLIAPFAGIHGWYLQNQSEQPVTVRLRMAGFYELVPGQAATPVRE